MTPRRVLVVEDDPSVRGLLQTLLLAEGYAVTTASDGVAGLAELEVPDRPALVLLDVMMPDLGGQRVLQQLKADPETASVPVIVVTGRVEAVPDLRGQLGDEQVFVKPFGVAELLARVHEVTGGPDQGGPP